MFHFARFIILLLALVVAVVNSQVSEVMPRSINFFTQEILAANGSSATGRCSNTTLNRNRTTTCYDPISSVLMDGIIPTLSGVGGDSWADQLMIMHQPLYGAYTRNIYFDFSLIPNWNIIRRVEVTLFNCLKWGAGINYFTIYNTAGQTVATVYPTVSSCNSLIKLCVPISNPSYPIQRIFFVRYSSLHTVPIAEISFFLNSEPCPLQVVQPGQPSPPTQTTSVSYSSNTEGSDIAPVGQSPGNGTPTANIQVEVGSSTVTQAVLSFLAIVTALQTTIILIVVIFVAYKYRQKQSMPSGASREDHAYERMDPVAPVVEEPPKIPAHGTARRQREPSLSKKSVSYTKPQQNQYK